MTEEIWRDIKGYEGKYQISSMGRVKALNYNHCGYEQMLKLKKERNGYLRVGLFKNGRLIQHSVHRLVAEAFILNPNNLPIVNHKNETKDDNRVKNLEWCDASYNITYSIGKEVLQLTLDGKIVNLFNSAVIASQKTKVYRGCISKCCLNQQTTSGGYIWRFLDDQLADWLEEIQDEDMAKEKGVA